MAFYSKFFEKKEDSSVIGIDIGSSAIKVVEIKKKHSQAVLETYGELALGPYGGQGIGQAVALPVEKVSEALSDLLKEKEVGISTKKSGLSIPFASSLMSLIEMPEVSSKQLAVMIPIEARKYIPVPISEVMLDWSVIPKGDTHSTEISTQSSMGNLAPVKVPKVDVLVVAIHNDTIARYKEIVTRTSLDTSFFEIEIFSTMRAVIDDTLTPVMIMDMGAASTKLYIVERGIIRASHTINRGSQDITLTLSKSLGIPPDRAEVMKRELGVLTGDKSFTEIITLTLDFIFAEANRTLLSYEKKHNKTVSKIVLVGGGSALKGIAPLAEASFKTQAITGDPFNKLSTPAFLDNILKEAGPEFAVAIGLALRRLAEEES
ncbi:MAG: type IV pilus assembly protein PilM [bacterium]